MILLGSFYCWATDIYEALIPPDPKTHKPYYYQEAHEYVWIDGEDRYVRFFMPKTSYKGYLMTNRPLVIILCGNGFTSGYNQKYYEKLGRHLAKNGFFVIKPDWKTSFYNDIEEKLQSAKEALISSIDHVYDRYEPYLSNDVALIGHSVGGAAVVRFANEVNGYTANGHQIDLRSIISMGASPKYHDMNEKRSLYYVSDSILFMDTSGDADSWGSKQNGVMKTGLKLYDDTGSDYISSSGYPEKDFIYFHRQSSNYNFKHSAFALDMNVAGYINAYLRLHIYKDTRYRYFFKYKRSFNSKSSWLRVYQQHHEKYKWVVASFEKESEDYFYGSSSTIRKGRIYTQRYQDQGTMEIEVGNSWEMDPFSPHKAKVLNAEWIRGTGVRGSSRLRLRYYDSKMPDIRNYRYLSFRVAQRTMGYNEEDPFNPDGDSLDFKVRLFHSDSQYSKLVKLSDYNQKIPYPKIKRMRVGVDQVFADVTKHPMHSVLLPLSAFKKSNGSALDMSEIKEIKFYFYGKGRITMDSIEFIK